jgi:hypothetical protein
VIVLTRRQVNLIRVGGISIITLCCCGLLLTLGGGAIAVKQRPEIIARLGLPVSSTATMTQTTATSVETPTVASSLDTPGLDSPLPTPTEVPPPPPTPTPEPPPPPPTPEPPTPPPEATPEPNLIAYYITGDLVNVREAPGTDAKIVRTARYGDEVAVYEDSIGQEWYRLAGESGDEYISAEFASNSVPPTNTPTGEEEPEGEETPTEEPAGEGTPTEEPEGEATPTEELPAPPPGKGLLIVYNSYTGQEITFDIANEPYKLNLGEHVEIPLAPGRYGWSKSAPFQDSESQDIEIREGETQTLHF